MEAIAVAAVLFAAQGARAGEGSGMLSGYPGQSYTGQSWDIENLFLNSSQSSIDYR